MNFGFMNPGVTEALGWTLVHSLWQAGGAALVLWSVFAFTRNPRVRYAAGVITLILMLAAPVVTFSYLLGHRATPAPTLAFTSSWKQVITDLRLVVDTTHAVRVPETPAILTTYWLEYFVIAWMSGVAVFSLRALGGFLLLERLLREQSEPISAVLRDRCHELQQRLGLRRTIVYVQSRLVEAPAVVGWFRPRVLLPLSALTGLSAQQLEAVIVHELAHIQRLDAFVNLFQLAAETLLFFHPAIWWVNRAIRAERENCCDDVSVRICGNAHEYVRALTALEAWRGASKLVLAANSGSLKARASRLLGFDVMVRSVSQTGVVMAILVCVAGALLAGTTLRVTSSAQPERSAGIAQAPPAAPEPPPAPKGWTPAAPATHHAVPQAAPEPPGPPSADVADSSDSDSSGANNRAEPDQDHEANPKESRSPVPAQTGSSYIDGLRAAGLRDIDVDQLIAMKIQGVTPDYVRQVHAAGLNPSVGELIGMKVQNISPDYIQRVRATWKDANLGEIIAMKVQGVDPGQAADFRRELNSSDISLGQLIAFKVQGVTPEYIRELRAAGFTDLSAGQIMSAKIQGVTPEFIRQVREHGFKNLTLHQLIGLKIAGIF